jgi:hypothetical protein
MTHDLHSTDEFPLSCYRDRTLSMLRRYARCAVELGRLPSLLGREFFRAKVTSYTVHTFEDAIIFAFDMERSLERLAPLERTLLGRIVLQEYTQREVARMLRIDRGNLQHKFVDAIDHLTEVLLDSGLLNASVLQPRQRRGPIAHANENPEPPASQNGTESGAPVAPITFNLNACQVPENTVFGASA